MKILSWYIAKDYLRYWVLTLVGLIVFVQVANLFGNLDDVFTSTDRLLAFLDESLRALPTIFDILLPMTVLLATVFTFSTLSRSSELVAMRAAGMGTLRQLLPIFAVLVAIAALDYVNQNYFQRWVEDSASMDEHGTEIRHWRSFDGRVVFVRRVDYERRRVFGLHVLNWSTDPYRLTRYRSAARAEPLPAPAGTPPEWRLRRVVTREAKDGRWPLQEKRWVDLPTAALPNFFVRSGPDAHHLPLFDLSGKIRQLENDPRRVELYVLEWYQNIAAMLAPFVLVWFGAPLAQGHHRRGRASGEIMVSILGGLAYMIATEIFFTLGKGGVLGPIAATFTVNAVFLVLGAVLLLRVR